MERDNFDSFGPEEIDHSNEDGGWHEDLDEVAADVTAEEDEIIEKHLDEERGYDDGPTVEEVQDERHPPEDAEISPEEIAEIEAERYPDSDEESNQE